MKRLMFFAVLLGTFLMQPQAWSKSLEVKIQATDNQSALSGVAYFEKLETGLKISIVIHKAPPGLHAFHIHEKGDCGDQGKAAGSHFNPDQSGHGDVINHGTTHAHAGDFGNLEVDENGTGRLEAVAKHLTIDKGHYGVLGRALIVHEKADDFSQPVGNAGARIACGVIPSEVVL